LCEKPLSTALPGDLEEIVELYTRPEDRRAGHKDTAGHCDTGGQ